jgi:hypothetical protein
MLTYRAHSSGDPETAWALISRPGRWQEWAPHIRGASGLGEPEVHAGARGAVRLLGVVPVPATIVERGVRSWRWRVASVEFEHRVEPRADGCEVIITIEAPRPVEGALALTYGPVVGLLVRNLARVAAAL